MKSSRQGVLSDTSIVGRTAHALATLPRGASGPAPAPSTAQVLSSLLDLQGSVRLADCLAARAMGERWQGLHAPLLLGDYVRKRSIAIAIAAQRRFMRGVDADAPSRRARLPSAAEVWSEIAASGAAAAPAAAKAVAMSIGRTYREEFSNGVARARAEVASLRDEVTDDLRALGGRAARLEAMDSALRAATDTGTTRLCERLAAAMEAAFVVRLRQAIARLPAESGATTIDAWLADDGVLGAELARMRDVTGALVAREAAVVVALVEAACDEARA